MTWLRHCIGVTHFYYSSCCSYVLLSDVVSWQLQLVYQTPLQSHKKV